MGEWINQNSTQLSKEEAAIWLDWEARPPCGGGCVECRKSSPTGINRTSWRKLVPSARQIVGGIPPLPPPPPTPPCDGIFQWNGGSLPIPRLRRHVQRPELGLLRYGQSSFGQWWISFERRTPVPPVRRWASDQHRSELHIRQFRRNDAPVWSVRGRLRFGARAGRAYPGASFAARRLPRYVSITLDPLEERSQRQWNVGASRNLRPRFTQGACVPTSGKHHQRNRQSGSSHPTLHSGGFGRISIQLVVHGLDDAHSAACRCSTSARIPT